LNYVLSHLGSKVLRGGGKGGEKKRRKDESWDSGTSLGREVPECLLMIKRKELKKGRSRLEGLERKDLGKTTLGIAKSVLKYFPRSLTKEDAEGRAGRERSTKKNAKKKRPGSRLRKR